MAVLAMISTAFENAVSECFHFFARLWRRAGSRIVRLCSHRLSLKASENLSESDTHLFGNRLRAIFE